VGGLVGTILLFIMYPFVTAAVKLDSPGPVFFKQKRMGREGEKSSLPH
jgi:lipopolysaccharide/colanic/teichoic acid biosynthesis glycosyltransferase